MKYPQKLLQTAAQKLDLPGEIMAGLPKLELTGFSQLTVELHQGILEYTEEAISLSVSLGTVRILGRHLTIRLMNHQYVTVAGEIERIELLEGPRHG